MPFFIVISLSMTERVIGFDVSSSTIGYCVLDIEQDGYIKFVSCDYLKPIKDGSIIDRLADTRNKIDGIISSYNPKYIGIENIVEFMKNKSQSKTIITLALFNRMVGLVAHDFLGHSPELFNVLTIRHGIKLSKALPSKEDIPEIVAKRLNIEFPYVYKRNKKIAPESNDMADGIAVALYYSLLLTNNLDKQKSKSKK